MDSLALWGAISGSAGVLIAGRREYLAGRRRLLVAPGVNLTTSRVEPFGHVQLGWACVAFWNTGGRPLAVERAGFQYLALQKDTGEPCVMRAMINLGTPIEAAVNGPTNKVYTPLGPMLAAGIHPFDHVEAIAITAGGREWFSPPQPLIKSVPSVSTTQQLSRGLEKLRGLAEAPPVVGNEIGLHREEPYLLDEPPDPLQPE